MCTIGKDSGLFFMGTVQHFCMVMVVTAKIALETRYWTVWTFLGVFGSPVCSIGNPFSCV